jgi:hypothetical protein
VVAVFPVLFVALNAINWLQRRNNVRIGQLFSSELVTPEVPDGSPTYVERGGIWVGRWAMTYPFAELRLHDESIAFVIRVPLYFWDDVQQFSLRREDFVPRYTGRFGDDPCPFHCPKPANPSICTSTPGMSSDCGR